ncbi:hypothetical protein ACWEWI_18130 [Streptomyces sp. NPDC003753]
MTGQTTPPPDRPAGQSFSATPSDQARTYQTGRDQTIHEHHHYASRGSLRAGLAWSLAGGLILALGAFVGVDLWERHTASDAAPAGDAETSSHAPSRSTVPTRSGSPSPSATATATTETAAPGASQPALPGNPAQGCTGWRSTDASDVLVKPCARIQGGRLYMIAEWRTTSGSKSVDVYLWLRDSSGRTTVFPGTDEAHGKVFPALPAWPTPQSREQWVEAAVDTDLTHGARYEVCVTVTDRGAPAPKIYNSKVYGRQYQVTYK